MDRTLLYGAAAAAVILIVTIPTRAIPTPEPIHLTVTLTDLPTPTVNITVPESNPTVNVTIPESPAPVVNIDMPAFPELPPTVVNVEQSEPQVIYRDREVERIVTVETPACLDYSDLPYFDLANALTVAFPGEPWSLSGSHYNGLVWHGETPQPDMTAIIGGWLTHLSESC